MTASTSIFPDIEPQARKCVLAGFRERMQHKTQAERPVRPLEENMAVEQFDLMQCVQPEGFRRKAR